MKYVKMFCYTKVVLSAREINFLNSIPPLDGLMTMEQGLSPTKESGRERNCHH